MTPKLSTVQLLVLQEIADDGVWFDLITGKWHSTYTKGTVTVQVAILQRGSYVTISGELEPKISLTPLGRQVLACQPLPELLACR